MRLERVPAVAPSVSSTVAFGGDWSYDERPKL
jgi:hypothetical protein